MLKDYLIPVRQRSDGAFAFMMVIEAISQLESKQKSLAIQREELSTNLYVDVVGMLKEYPTITEKYDIIKE